MAEAKRRVHGAALKARPLKASPRGLLVFVLVLVLVLGALGARVEAAVDLACVLAAPRRVCILTAAVVVPHPARAVLGRVR